MFNKYHTQVLTGSKLNGGANQNSEDDVGQFVVGETQGMKPFHYRAVLVRYFDRRVNWFLLGTKTENPGK